MKTLQELPRNLPNIGSLIHSNPLWIEARDEIWNEINNSNSCFVAKSSKSSETGGLECKLKCHHHLFVIAAFSTKAIIWSKPEEPWSIWKVYLKRVFTAFSSIFLTNFVLIPSMFCEFFNVKFQVLTYFKITYESRCK